MRITFTCPSGHKLRARPEKAGTKAVCPACGAQVDVPQPRAVVQRPPAPPSSAASDAQSLGIETTASKAAQAAPPPLPSEKPAPAPPPLPAADVSAAAQPSRPPLPRSAKRTSTEEKPVRDTVEKSAPSGSPPSKVPPLPKAANIPVSPEPIQTKNAPPPAENVVAPPLITPPHPLAPAAPIAAATIQDAAESTTSPLAQVRGYQPDRYKRAATYWLGLALVFITIMEMIPAVSHSIRSSAPFFTISGAPPWAQAVLVLCLLQLVYVAWMVSLPDWSTVWTLMAIYGLVAALYGYVLAVSLMTPRDQELLLGLDAVRRLTPLWCSAMILLTFLGAFLCGRTSSRWHRAYVALVKARGLRW